MKLTKKDHVLINNAAAELVEEILETIRNNTGRPWFAVIETKMRKLVQRVKSPQEQSPRKPGTAP